MKDYINGDIWDFERDIVVPGDRPVILGLDGGATSTICVCMPFLPFSSPLPDPLPVLSRAVTGCSNRNSVGEIAARETLEHVIADALSKSGSSRSAVQAVCLAVSGVNHPTDEQRILNWLRDIFPSHVKLYVQNDAVAALATGKWNNGKASWLCFDCWYRDYCLWIHRIWWRSSGCRCRTHLR
ncbi:hypothetical protein MANES_01G131701v8 [Manihot esculenta]|uniref:Uncharacterized protein n=1 Tax=Manihot esculenta TaxID=3983 RepID=A0ACB7IDZ6_MANES|nr:hypothetical protein MANES_01G131701v8 [Manihot esculenta]